MKQSKHQQNKSVAENASQSQKSIADRVAAVRESSAQGSPCDAGFGN